MASLNEGTYIDTNYDGITEEKLQALSPEIINTLAEKYKITWFFNEGIDKPESLNQLLDLVHTQTFDPSLHRILLNFFNELFNTDPVFKTYAEQLKPLLKVRMAVDTCLELKPVNQLRGVRNEINELIDLKRLYPELNYKQLICLWIYEFLPTTHLIKDKTIATVLQGAETFLKEKNFEAFVLIISEIADCVKYIEVEEIKKHFYLFHSIRSQSTVEKPPSAKDISKELYERTEAKLKTPPTLLNLLKQGAFQQLCTDYCTVICALVSTYLLIQHVLVLHEKDGLRLDELKNELLRLIHVNTSEFNSGDIASDIINAFYQSDFYKKQIKNEDYTTRHTVEGIIDFQQGQSFNNHIKTNTKHLMPVATRAADINQLHNLLNIALINLLQDKTDTIFKIVPIFSGIPRPDFIQTVFPCQGRWLGDAHIALELQEGLINAPKGFVIETTGFMANVPGFAFQPISLIHNSNLMNVAKQELEETKLLHENPTFPKLDIRGYFVNGLKALLVDYQSERAKEYAFKDKFFSTDKKVREQSIIELQTLFTEYNVTGDNSKLLAKINACKSQFPGRGFSSVLNKITAELMDTDILSNPNLAMLNPINIMNAKKDTNPDYVKQIHNLYSALDDMNVFAQALKDSKERETISNLTHKLRKDIDNFVKVHHDQLPTEKTYLHFKVKVFARLHSEDKLMSKHEQLWKPILRNILIAIFTLGIALGIQLAQSKINTGKMQFFGTETEKEKKRDQVAQVLSKIG